MKKVVILSLLGLVGFTTFFLISGFHIHQNTLEKISMDMDTRKAEAGKLTQLKASIYFHQNGRMITRFNAPLDIVVINNSKGDLNIYNPKENTVAQKFNYTYSTENSSIYYFLKGNANDLGLKALGFKLNSSKIDKEYLVTNWLPSVEYMKYFSTVELVFKQNAPIYIKFIGTNAKVVKKSYYYNYKKIYNLNFPETITNIYFNDKGDSSIEKVSYSNLKLNTEANNSYFDFIIPSNAKLIK